MNKKEQLKQAILELGLKTSKTDLIVSKSGKLSNWILDLRAVFLHSESLNCFAELFWEEMKGFFPFQVGGIELSSVPMISAILIKGQGKGFPTNGFIIRKDRKTYGLQKRIEGDIQKDVPIVLVDDLINGGSSLKEMCEILKQNHYTPSYFFTLVDYENSKGKTVIQEENIKHVSLFCLKNLNLELQKRTTNEIPYKDAELLQNIAIDSPPDFFHTEPQNNLAQYKEKTLYVADNGSLFCFDEEGIPRCLFDTHIILPESQPSNLVIDEKFALWTINKTQTLCFNLETETLVWKKQHAKIVSDIFASNGHICIQTQRSMNTFCIQVFNISSQEKQFEAEFSEISSITSANNSFFFAQTESLINLPLNTFVPQKIALEKASRNIVHFSNDKIVFLENLTIIHRFSLSERKTLEKKTFPLIQNVIYTTKHILISTSGNKLFLFDSEWNPLKEFMFFVKFFTSFERNNSIFLGSEKHVFQIDLSTLALTCIKQSYEKIKNIFPLDDKRIIISTEGNTLAIIKNH